MPNYGLVINSRFRPFSYQEMLAPTLQATQAHQAVEDAYSELEMKANTLETVLNKERDPELYQQYREYIDALGSVSDELARNGLTPTSRQMASNLRGRYASDIVPIQAAAERRAAIAKAQRDALMKDPTTLFSGRAAETNLKEFYDNPTLDFENYSGALLAKQVSDQASSIAKQLTDLKTGKLDTYTNTLTQQLGLTPAQLQAAIKDPTNAYYGTVINAIVDNVMQSSGIPTWGNYNNIKNQALGYAREGLYSAIGEQRLSTYANKAAELATQHANAMAQLREQYRLKGEEEKEKARLKAEQDRKERTASLGTRQRYNITQDDRVKKYKRLGILQEDANGHLSVDRAAFERFSRMSPAEMRQYSEDLSAQIKVIDDMTKHPAKGGQRNPNYFQYITYDDARRMFPELGFHSGNKGLNVNDQAKLKKHLDNTRASLIETRDAFNSGTGVAQLYSDFGDLGGLSAGDVRTNIDLFERALNANIGDRYTMNQNLYYTVDESQSKAFLNSAKNKQGSLAGLPQYYLDERGSFGKPSSISTKDLDASEIHNVIVRKGKDGKTHAYYELTTKSGEDVALQLPDDLATSLIRYSDDLDAAKRDYLVYQQTLEQDRIDLPYRMRTEHNGQLTLPDRSDIAVTVDDLNNILDNFALAAADLAKTNKTKPVEIQP